MTEPSSQPVQLRLSFPAPSSPIVLQLVLAGAQVLVDTDPDREHEAWSYLHAAGTNPTMSTGKGLSFPTGTLHHLSELPSQVTTVAHDNLVALHALATHPSHQNTPAELTLTGAEMWLSWTDGHTNYTEPLPDTAATALLTAHLPFVASTEAFEHLRRFCQLPMLVGKARLNLDGYIEITTARPSMVESAPLPGAFRIDATHFGLALPHARAIDEAPGFVWEGHKPQLERGPAVLAPMPVPLSTQAQADLRQLVDNIASYRAQAIVWESGLGRRVFALAALEALDAWPALIVCSPSSVWAWQRHLDMFGRTGSVTANDADAHLVTYRDLAHRSDVLSPQAVLFDDLTCEEAHTPETRAALRRLDNLMDAYRIACAATWPTVAEDIVDVMSVLRPGEFAPDIPVAQRYLPTAKTRLQEHAEAYLSRRTREDAGSERHTFRRSSVTVLSPTEAQRDALAASADRHRGGSVDAQLNEALEIVSAGPQLALSPKIPEAVSQATAALNKGHRVCVLTRHRRTAMMIKASMRSAKAVSVDVGAGLPTPLPEARMVVVRFDRELPDVSWFDTIIVCDYPWSAALLDAAVGSAHGDQGPMQVTVLHMAGTVDDRLAMLAARRREMGALIDHTAPPSEQERAMLLAHRN